MLIQKLAVERRLYFSHNSHSGILIAVIEGNFYLKRGVTV